MGSDPWVVLQHVPYEGPGALVAAVRDTEASLKLVRIDDGDEVPNPDDVDAFAGSW